MMMEMFVNISMKNQMLIIMFMIFSSIMSTKSNPMKLSWKMMLMMIMTSFLMYIFTFKSFLPLLITIIMIGGLLMIYIMMMSMMPNKKMSNWKSTKIKIILTWFSIMALMMMFVPLNMNIHMNEMKMNMMNMSMFYFLSMLMFIYFFLNMTILEKEKTSLRSTN